MLYRFNLFKNYTNFPKMYTSISTHSSSSLHLFTSTKPKSPLSKQPTNLPLIPYKPISFQQIPTKKQSFSPPFASKTMSLQPIEELPPKLQEIVKLFQSVSKPKAKYEQLLFYGKNLKPLDNQFKTRENKVEGCVSQVWVRSYLDSEKNVYFEADSDSVLTKGLAALLVQGLSGSSVSDVLRVSPDFVVLLGLQQSLTPSRNNGFLNMLKLMQKKALELFVEAEKGIENDRKSLSLGSGSGGNSSIRVESSEDLSGDLELKDEDDGGSGGGGGDDDSLGSRGKRIKEILERELSPVELEVEDVSYQHAGHAGVRGNDDGETHFNLKVVSKEFEGKSLVKRHRLIYSLLQDELQNGLHALSIVAKTPDEVGSR